MALTAMSTTEKIRRARMVVSEQGCYLRDVDSTHWDVVYSYNQTALYSNQTMTELVALFQANAPSLPTWDPISVTG